MTSHTVNNGLIRNTAALKSRDRLGFQLQLLPIFLIASGPPIFRLEKRSALASLHGSIDVWILLQVAVYGIALFLALPVLMSIAKHAWPRDVVFRLFSLLGLCGLLLASSLWSPSPMSTFVLAAMFTCGILVGIQTVYSCGTEPRPLYPLLDNLKWLILGLLAVAVLFHQLDLVRMAKMGPTGWRYRGNDIVSVMDLAPILCVVTLYGVLNFQVGRLSNVILLTIGLFATYMTRTRTSYAIAAAGMLMVWWMWTWKRPQGLGRRTGLRIVGSMLVIVSLLFLGVLGSDELYNQWTRGEGAGLTTFSKRSLIWDWIVSKVAQQPFGYGYIAGFRDEFLNMQPAEIFEFKRSGLIVARIGEAHNSYYEILMAIGWPGLALLMIILIPMSYRFIRAAHINNLAPDLQHTIALGTILLLMLLLDATTTSAVARALRQPFGVFVLTCAVTSAALWRVRWPLMRSAPR